MTNSEVDILICTTGERDSLDQAILSALSQTYKAAHCVVISDGPCPAAEKRVERMRQFGSIDYYETPLKLGSGNCVKDWYINYGPSRRPWIRTLDDDDWLPVNAIEDMMLHALSRSDVSLVTCEALTLYHKADIQRYRVCPGHMVEDELGFGGALFSLKHARGIPIPNEAFGDFQFLRAVAERGHWIRVPMPLYVYQAYRDNHDRGYA